MKPPKFVALLVVQFAVPALVYFAIALALRHRITLEDAKWLAPNYAYMAAPHLLLGLIAALVARFRPHLMAYLATGNIALMLFAVWLTTQVPTREIGLAWILYPPVELVALAIAAVSKHFIAKTSQQDRGTPSEA